MVRPVVSDSFDDKNIIDQLKEIDADEDIDVTSFEADFLSTVLVQRSLSSKQRAVAEEMISKYLGD